jgi:hypothetical protein
MVDLAVLIAMKLSTLEGDKAARVMEMESNAAGFIEWYDADVAEGVNPD